MPSLKIAAGLTLSALIATSALAQAPAAPATSAPPPAARPAPPPLPAATQPVPRDDIRHKTFVWQAQKGNIDLLFVGDSITDWWRQPQRGLPEFEKAFGQYRTANFGIAGDTTQGVLWRMRNGELEGFKAKVIVFMLGTNNIGRNTNADIAAGDRAIIQEFRKRQPQAKILVLGVFPRDFQPGTPNRQAIAEINSHLAKLADDKNVFYMDIGSVFLSPDGTMSREVMDDGLHPTTRGYALWADAIDDKVRELMR